MHTNQFPRSAKYDTEWVERHSIGENVLYNLESLTEVLPLERGMRVLDLGCGNAISSIFLAKEFGVSVWAIDREVSPTENYKRICEMGCADLVHPMHADATSLPFSNEYFDVILAIDSYLYFGTDRTYLNYILSFLKPHGKIGIVDACVRREVVSILDIRDDLRADFLKLGPNLHSTGWWRALWEADSLVTILTNEVLPESEFILDQYILRHKFDTAGRAAVKVLSEDKEHLFALFRMIAEKK